MTTFPQAASPAQQPPGPEDEDLSLDEYDLYNLAPSYLGKVWPGHLPGPLPSTPTPPLGFLLGLLPTPHPSLTCSLDPSSHPFQPLFPLVLPCSALGPHTPLEFGGNNRSWGPLISQMGRQGL